MRIFNLFLSFLIVYFIACSSDDGVSPVANFQASCNPGINDSLFICANIEGKDFFFKQSFVLDTFRVGIEGRLDTNSDFLNISFDREINVGMYDINWNKVPGSIQLYYGRKDSLGNFEFFTEIDFDNPFNQFKIDVHDKKAKRINGTFKAVLYKWVDIPPLDRLPVKILDSVIFHDGKYNLSYK